MIFYDFLFRKIHFTQLFFSGEIFFSDFDIFSEPKLQKKVLKKNRKFFRKIPEIFEFFGKISEIFLKFFWSQKKI